LHPTDISLGAFAIFYRQSLLYYVGIKDKLHVFYVRFYPVIFYEIVLRGASGDVESRGVELTEKNDRELRNRWAK